jgi:hypothetical protein
VRAENNSTPRGVAWDAYDVPRGATWAELYWMGDEVWRWMGFGKFEARPPGAAGPAQGARPPAAVNLPRRIIAPGAGGGAVMPAPASAAATVRRMVAPWLFSRPYTAYALPYWVPVALTSGPAAMVIAKSLRRWARRRRGLCPGCGYDLRETSERCPECGEGKGRGRRSGEAARTRKDVVT